jgi:hypothetical protein
MRLNILNQAAVVRAACSQADNVELNPRFGETLQISPETFKYSALGNPSKSLLIARVSLNELFDKFPQDITGFEFKDPAPFDSARLESTSEIDPTVQEYILDNNPYETVPETDVLGTHFCNWKRLVGLTSLTRSEVDLSSDGDYMLIDARNATIHRGTVSVKIK